MHVLVITIQFLPKNVLQFFGPEQSSSRLCPDSYTVAVLISTPTRTIGPLGTLIAGINDWVWLGAAMSVLTPHVRLRF